MCVVCVCVCARVELEKVLHGSVWTWGFSYSVARMNCSPALQQTSCYGNSAQSALVNVGRPMVRCFMESVEMKTAKGPKCFEMETAILSGQWLGVRPS